MNTNEIHESIIKHTQCTFSRSGGKGGQNVNKVNTKVYAYINLTMIEGLSENERIQIKSKLASNINKDNDFFVSVQQERSQELNRKIALKLMEAKILQAGKLVPVRKKTKVPKSINEKRLQQKRLISKLKQMRSKNW